MWQVWLSDNGILWKHLYSCLCILCIRIVPPSPCSLHLRLPTYQTSCVWDSTIAANKNIPCYCLPENFHTKNISNHLFRFLTKITFDNLRWQNPINQNDEKSNSQLVEVKTIGIQRKVKDRGTNMRSINNWPKSKINKVEQNINKAERTPTDIVALYCITRE